MYVRPEGYNMQPNKHVEYQYFDYEYFSGADMHIYFGDIWVDEVTSLAFTLEENVRPIYGYNSFTFDHVARGNRIIRGAFNLNFKTVGYLQEIIKHTDALEYALQRGNKSYKPDPSFYHKYRLHEILEMYGKESFDQIADEYEKALWGEDSNSELLNSDNEPFFQSQLSEGFDLRINYGPVTEVKENPGFFETNNNQPNRTVEVINGVQLTSVQKAVSTKDQGAPIQESYSFIARDLNGSFIT